MTGLFSTGLFSTGLTGLTGLCCWKIIMKTIENVKAFDCLKMKRDIQARIYDETKDMDAAGLLAYFNRQGGSEQYPAMCVSENVFCRETGVAEQ